MATQTKTKKTKAMKAPTVNVTHADFDSQEPFRVVRNGVPIQEFTPLGYADYQPRGGTPLLDATAKMIAHLGEASNGSVQIGLLLDRSGSMGGNEGAVIEGVNQFVAGMADVKKVDPKAAGKTLCVIITDGLENSSREVDRATLSKMIAEREAQGWTFIYMGANQDAWGEAGALGYSGSASGQSVNFASTPKGTRSAFASVTSGAQHYLGDHEVYASMDSASSQRTVAEDGTETDKAGNVINQAPTTSTPYGDVADALKKAKSTTEGS